MKILYKILQHTQRVIAGDRKLTKAFCCQIDSTVRLMPSCSIINNLGIADKIQIGRKTMVRGELLTFAHGGEIHIGEHCYIGEGTRIWSARLIRIGDRVLISHNVNVFDNDTHPIEDPNARHRQFIDIISTGHPKHIDLNEKAVVIGDDVLIGCQSIILKGVSIGEAAVVSAGSVVTRDVPPYTIVAGNPAKIIRIIDRNDK
jgi:acetyltransferase-like isoleucine patch superfamily enzyme